MRQLDICELDSVSGSGFFALVPLIITAVAVFCAPKHIADAANRYDQWGQQIGEATWEHFHPYDPNR